MFTSPVHVLLTFKGSTCDGVQGTGMDSGDRVGGIVTVRARKKMALFGSVALAAALILPVPVATAVADSPCWTYSKSERKLAQLHNIARSAAGKVALKLDPELSRVASKHTSEMVRRRDLFHTPSETLKKRVTNWRILGENIGRGSSATSLHRAFMDSLSHRENILRSGYRYIGVGTKRAGGKLWVTVVFEGRKNPGTTLSMPSC